MQKRICNENVRILGIDPGVGRIGWAIVDFGVKVNGKINVVDSGIISTSKHKILAERLQEIYVDLQYLCKKYKPSVSGIETLLFCKNVKTAIQVGEARGVVLLTLQQHNLIIYDCSPLQVKQSVTGYGRADKDQVEDGVRLLCNLNDVPDYDDAFDAIAVAICAYDFYKRGALV